MTVADDYGWRKRPGTSGLVLDEIERWTELSLGLVGVVTDYSRETLAAAEGTAGAEQADGPTAAGAPLAHDLDAADLLAVLPGALATLGLRLQSRIFDAVAEAEHQVATVMARLGTVKLTSPVAQRLHEWLAGLDAEFQSGQDERVEVAAAFLGSAGPRTLDELLARIDLEAVLDRVDMEVVLDKVDMELVLDRVDLDAVLERVDLDAVVARLDVNDLMSGVIQDLQVAGLLRDSTGAIVNSTAGALRTQVGGVANRITGRK